MTQTAIPALRILKPGKQWVCFDEDKKPISPVTLYGVSGALVEGNADWVSYQEAIKVWKANSSWLKGVGREFIKSQNITGIDLDGCIDEQGNIAPWAQAEIDRLNSYTELSPSERGVHIWVYGSIPCALGSCGDGYEMYDSGRYFTVTGKHLPGTPTTIEDRHEEVLRLHSEITARRKPSSPPQEQPRRRTATREEAYAQKALDNIYRDLAATQEGTRNQHLYQAAFRLGTMIGAGWISRTVVEQGLRYAATRCELGKQEIERTLRSGINGGTKVPHEPLKTDGAFTEYKAEPGGAGNGNGYHKQPIDEQPSSFNRTDLGNGERFAAQYADRVRWCQIWNSWLVFNGCAWEQDKTGLVDQLAKEAVRSIYKEAASEADDAERKRLAKHAIASESNRAVRAMLDRAKSELPARPEDFNRHIHLLNCQNGTLDLRTGELRRHNPADMLTRCLKIGYNPLAPCPRWLHFIHSIFDNELSLIDFMQRALGMSLSGDVSEQCWFLCHGGGSNGKTTLLETVRIITDCYGLAANVETFQLHKGERISNDVAELYGARFVTADENTMGSRLNEAFVKKITGKQPLRARRLHENEFQFMPECTIWFAVNHKPIVKDTTKGMWRRVHYVPFLVTIEGDQVDTHLGDKLLEESEGILAWLVQGCLTWYQQGRLQPPQIVKEATQAYRDEMDVVARFLDECCKDANQEIGATKLYQAYKTWCDETGERWENQKTFGTRLSERGYAKERTRNGIVYRGIQLQSVNDVNDVNDGSGSTSGENKKSPEIPTNGSHHSHRSQKEEADWHCVTCGADVEDFSHIDVDGTVHEQPDVPYCLVHKPSEDLNE